MMVGSLVGINEVVGDYMKIWVDDIRPAPHGYVWCKSVNEAKRQIAINEGWIDGETSILRDWDIDLLDLDHDAGDFVHDGGDYIKLLDWLEEMGLKYPIRIHTMNPVGRENMRRIIHRNGWIEIDI